MFKNYFTIALRNLLRNKILSVINILGLAIGIGASLVIFLVVRYDYSFDQFEPNANRLYRIVSDYAEQGNEGHTRGTQAPLVNAVKKEITGVDLLVAFRYYSPGKELAKTAGETTATKFGGQKKIIFADAAYFKMLPFRWLAGSATIAMHEPGQVVLDETRAKLYFPNKTYDQIIGSTITYDDTLSVSVQGIVQDLNKQGNTDFTFKEFISLATITDNQSLRKNFNWDDWGATTSDQQLFVRLTKENNPAIINAKLHVIADKYLGDDEKKNNFTWNYRLQSLSDIHFNKQYGILDSPVSNKSILYGMELVAVFLLLLACINFINLTTAQSGVRAKEIGVRKTMGGSRRQLLLQFLSETFTVTFVAGALSVVLLPLLIKAFADYMPRGFHFTIADPAMLIFLISLIVIVSLMAGMYPSMALSSLNAATVLKGQSASISKSSGKVRMRQTLTVSQFVIAQFFIMATLMVVKQIHYMLHTDLGFRKEAVMSFQTPNRDTSAGSRHALMNDIKQLPAVEIASLASDVANSGGWWHSSIDYKDGKKELHTNVEKCTRPIFLLLMRCRKKYN